MDQGDGLVAGERVLAVGQGEVGMDVGRGPGEVHAVDLVAEGEPLVEGGVGAKLEAVAECGLADQESGEEVGSSTPSFLWCGVGAAQPRRDRSLRAGRSAAAAMVRRERLGPPTAPSNCFSLSLWPLLAQGTTARGQVWVSLQAALG